MNLVSSVERARGGQSTFATIEERGKLKERLVIIQPVHSRRNGHVMRIRVHLAKRA
jgi:hypothetical protein